MGNDKKPAPNTTPLAPLVCPADVPVDDCKTALIFSDKAPLIDLATKMQKCDLKAVWTFTPPPPADKLSVLVFLHGNKNSVTVNADGTCRMPDWAAPKPKPGKPKETLPGETVDEWLDPKKSTCAPKGFELAKTATDNQQPLVLAPEDAEPVGRVITSAGNLGDKPALGNFVDDCFDHLSDAAKLKKTRSCGGGTYLPKKPALTDIKRLFLCAHSGGGRGLAKAALSDLVISRPTDLCLLDCTYGWGNSEYPEFCKTKKASLGNAAGQDRLLCFYLPAIRDTDTVGKARFFDVRRKEIQKENDAITKDNEKRAQKNPPLPPRPLKDFSDQTLENDFNDQWNGSTKQHVEDNIIPAVKKLGIKFDESLPASGTKPALDHIAIHLVTGDLTKIETACSLYPIVFVEVGGVGHNSIPNTFIPVMLKTAKV